MTIIVTDHNENSDTYIHLENLSFPLILKRNDAAYFFVFKDNLRELTPNSCVCSLCVTKPKIRCISFDPTFRNHIFTVDAKLDRQTWSVVYNQLTISNT